MLQKTQPMQSSRNPFFLTFFGLLIAAGLGLATIGCGGPATIPVNYAPSSIMTVSGSLMVADFTYPPSVVSTVPGKSPVAPNQIRNTAMGDIKIDREVKQFVRDAVFSELRLVGLKIDNNSRVLKGDIEEFLIDDLGYNVDWTLRIKYVVSEPGSDKVLYSSVKNIKRRTAKFANPFGAMNETIKLNVEELLKDPDFVKCINS
jgi:hypothetical protein